MGSNQRKSTDAEEIDTANRFKFKFKKLVNFRVIKVQRNTVFID